MDAGGGRTLDVTLQEAVTDVSAASLKVLLPTLNPLLLHPTQI
jgi:hypothetical protein